MQMACKMTNPASARD